MLYNNIQNSDEDRTKEQLINEQENKNFRNTFYQNVIISDELGIDIGSVKTEKELKMEERNKKEKSLKKIKERICTR